MLISQRCRYAIKAVLELAIRPLNEPVKVQQIADAQEMPERFLEVILNELRHGGFVASRRGSDGGYYLVKRPAELTLGELIEHIQGPVEDLIVEEKIEASDNSFGTGALRKLRQQITGRINDLYYGTTIADLVEWESTAKLQATNYMI
ncbi:MAG: Rrf2 family transcriptional regulator [Sedimentisphaerales bacterium]|nr:Rrf2 family transcriptional regulator [Sedimentisphaerales bacterium]